MRKTLRLAIVAVLCAGFVAAADAADTKSERNKYGFYAPYFGHDPEDRYRFRTEAPALRQRRVAHAEPSRTRLLSV